MKIDDEGGELRATLRPGVGGCAILATVGFFAICVAVCCVSVGALIFFGARTIGLTAPAAIARYGEYVPWRGGVGRGVLAGLLLWCLLWIWFAISIGGQLLRVLAGSDVITIGSDLAAERRIGPFGTTRSFAVQSVRGVSVRRNDGALTVSLDDGSVAELTKSGTAEERKQLRDLIRQRFYIAAERSQELTAAFDQATAPDGTHVVTVSAALHRRVVGWTAVITAVWLAATGWHFVHDRQFNLGDPMMLIAVLLIVALVCIAGAEQSWQVKKGSFVFARALGPWRRRSEYDGGTFRVEERRDSDGDVLFTLIVEQNGRKDRLHSGLNEGEDVVALGRFLARESGFPFGELPSGLRDE